MRIKKKKALSVSSINKVPSSYETINVYSTLTLSERTSPYSFEKYSSDLFILNNFQNVISVNFVIVKRSLFNFENSFLKNDI